MAIKTVQKKVDDLDGKELPDSTRPWRVTFQGKAYDLLVTPENRKKIEDYWSNLTKDAIRVKADAPRRGNGRSADEMSQIRNWLNDNGYKVAKAGMIKKEFLHAYDAAHAEESDAKKD